MSPQAAFHALNATTYTATELTRGPWDPQHQHAGPPSALACRAIEMAAAEHGLTHLSRFTANLLRPVPIGDITTQVQADYVGKNTGHFSGELIANGKAVLRFTALVQRENPIDLPHPLLGHPWPSAPRPPGECPIVHFPLRTERLVTTNWSKTDKRLAPCSMGLAPSGFGWSTPWSKAKPLVPTSAWRSPPTRAMASVRFWISMPTASSTPT